MMGEDFRITLCTELGDSVAPAVVMILSLESYEEKIVVFDEYCTNPDCDCRDMNLVFFNLKGNKVEGDLFKIGLNVDTWELLSKETYTMDFDSDGLINKFLREMTDQTKKVLLERFEFGKISAGEVEKKDINVDLLRSGKCLFYHEVFESKNLGKLMFELDNNRYLVWDQYCTNPTCKCNEAILLFLKAGETGEYNEYFSIRLKIKTKKYKVENLFKNIKKDEMDRVIEAFIENVEEDEIDFLKERYDRMKRLKKIYPEIGTTDFLKNSTDVEKVSRNALCPCGSGKKYKKCCG